MSYLPCKNPNCNSYGKPHPNCKCYAGMAKGGEAKHFCEKVQEHDKGCQYFAEGSTDGPVQDESEPTWDNTAPTENDASSNIESSAPTWEDTSPAPDNNVQTDPAMPTWENTTGKYDSPGQQIGATVEGVAQGFAGPLATLAEQGLSKAGVPDLSDEDIKGRQEANPWEYGAGQVAGIGAALATGVGEAGLATKGAAALLPEALPVLGKFGSTFLKGAIANAVIAGGNEVSKAMLGQGNPDHAVSSALANAGIAGLLGGVFEGAGSLIPSVPKNLGTKATSFLAGLGAKASADPLADTAIGSTLIDKELFDPKMFQKGADAYEKLLNTAVTTSAVAGTGTVLAKTGLTSAPFSVAIYEGFKKLLDPIYSKAGNLAAPTFTKWISEGGGENLGTMLNYAGQVNKGDTLLSNGVNALFKEGYQQIAPKVKDTAKEAVDEWIGNGGVDHDVQESVNEQNANEAVQRGYAKGGEVKALEQKKSGIFGAPNGLAESYPDQNMMIQTAKGRISNYLRSLKPQENAPRLAFDSAPDQREQSRSYEKALNLAISPLRILEEIKQGTVEPIHVKHFNSMYPDLNNVLQQKLTQRISEAQLKNEKPSYTVRQGLSMLLGTPLSSEMKPENIQAAQAVYVKQQMQQQPSAPEKGKNKKSTSSLSKSDQSFLTQNQSLVSRSQKQ